jgi:hypothetical protein
LDEALDPDAVTEEGKKLLFGQTAKTFVKA